jgi:hypothetical protein
MRSGAAWSSPETHKWVNCPVDFGPSGLDPVGMTSTLATELPRSHSRPGDSRADSRPPSTRAVITRGGERTLRATLERLRHQLEVEFAGRMRTTGALVRSPETTSTCRPSRRPRFWPPGLPASRGCSSRRRSSPARWRRVASRRSEPRSGSKPSPGAVREHRLIGDFGPGFVAPLA